MDSRIIINSKLVTAQMESGSVFGLTAALKSQITLKNGQLVQRNFHDFSPVADERNAADGNLHRSSDQPPLGIGESAIALVSPAVTNAIFAATGKRIRKLPVDTTELSRIL